MQDAPIDWKTHGVKVIPGDSLDTNTPQTSGMNRAAAINFARVGAQKIWAGTVHIHPGAKTGAHHHGALESVIYVLRGRARMRWGEQLEYVAEAGPGDFIFVPPYYDSLVAKLIVHAPTRARAINRMRRALDEFAVVGIKTTIPLHQRIVDDPQFQAGDYTIHWLEKFVAGG